MYGQFSIKKNERENEVNVGVVVSIYWVQGLRVCGGDIESGHEKQDGKSESDTGSVHIEEEKEK